MSKSNITDKISEMIMPFIESNSFELVDVEYLKEGPNWYLRVYIDKDFGVTIDDCELVSQHLSDLLDKHDPIPQSYILEVSSPGLERPLKKDSEFEKYKGETVEVRLYSKFEDKDVYEGKLIGLIDGNIVINSNEKEMSFDRKSVSLVKRIFQF